MTTQDTPAREFELKLAVPEASVPTLLHHPRFGGPSAESPPPRHQVTTYFDTPDHALACSGMTLRVRNTEGRRVQNVKADRGNAAAADRAEWEWAIDQDWPDLSLLVQTGLADRLPPRAELAPVLTTDISRTTLDIALEDGTLVEAAFDEGAIIAGAAREPVRELELELRHGDPAAVYQLALELHAAAPLTLEHESKAARGYRLGNGVMPRARKARHVELAPRTTGADAFAQILGSGLDHLLANRAAALAGNAEGLHQMRVAIRRLRAALRLFRPLLEATATARFEAELRRIGQVLGEARDWDVFCQQILPETLDDDVAEGWRHLLQQPAEARRSAAYRHVAQEVEGRAFTGLAIGLAAWAEQGRRNPRLLGDAALGRSITDIAPSLLDRLAHKVARRGRHIAQQSDPQRHALRKSLKKLRYGIDYLAALYPHKAVKPYLHACKKLQQVLGDSNDAVTATGLAQRLAEGPRPDLAPALGALASELERRRAQALADLPKRWRKFRAAPHFWA